MTLPAFWNDAWTVALANHLWQSSLVTGIAGLLSLSLRKNHARMRYWVWMIASVKYLIPFSLLIAIGESLRSAFSAPIQRPLLAAAMEQIALPFSPAASPAALPYAGAAREAAATASRMGNLWPVILLAAWLCGFLLVVFSWMRGWSLIRASIRSSSRTALLAEVPVLSSPLLLEPGVFGIFRPVLLLPQGIDERLSLAQLDAIIAHEICHLRRRDNLTAAIHMVVEALFWFHPAVWWIKTRLLEERELACDEVVLQSGNEADIYAESILNVCKFCIESPLACVAGVAGSDLKGRIVRIMTGKAAHNLDLGRKLLLVLAATVAISIPVVFGLVHIQQADALTPTRGIAGTWQCTLHSGLDLRGVIEISRSENGRYKGVFYAIDQTSTPIPVTGITLDGAAVKISFAEFGALFEGKLAPDGRSISGSLNQLSFVHPLTLRRTTTETAWEIPKPEPPMATDTDPGILAATIRPSQPEDPSKGLIVQMGHIRAANATLSDLITYAYGIHPKQLAGAPAWVDKGRFDIDAKFSGEGQPSPRQIQSLVQKLLAQRFKLSLHRDKKELSVYALSKGGGSSKLVRSQDTLNQEPELYFQDLGKLKVSHGSMQEFVSVMQSSVLDRPVIDRTGLTGRYDFTLDWTPDESQFRAMGAVIPHPTGRINQPPPLSAAIQGQLGLKLDSTMASVEMIVIDHVEKPVEVN
ncbi:MAG: M56 family metallopeptidase [Terracidiphilus sp.]